MSPTSREREYARRRYEKWQSKQAERERQRRRARRTALAAMAAVVAVLGVIGTVVLLNSGDDGSPSTALEPTASASAGSSAASTVGSSAASTAGSAGNPCAKPAAAAVTNPKSFKSAPDGSLAQGKSWSLAVQTTCGPLLITLDGAKAPKAVASTIFLSRNGFWNGSPCHRLTTTGIYVLQCGDPTGTGTGGPGYSYGPVENAPAGDVYKAGTLAMARQGDNGSSMGSQFFLVYKDSTIPSDNAGGYTVFGKIVGGLDVVEKVAAGGVAGGGTDGKPVRAISITSTSVSPG